MKWAAKVDGYTDGTPAYCSVFKRDISGPDSQVLGIDTRVQSGKVEGEWAYVVESPAVPQKAGAQRAKARRVVEPGPYSAPEYYFEVTVGNSRARSGTPGPQVRGRAQVP